MTGFWRAMGLAAACTLGACETIGIPANETLLSEDQIIDLMEHPRRWDGRVVTMQVYPYDSGFAGSYVICFEACDADYAAKSPFLIYTTANRFKGYKGDRAIVVRARYDATCFYKSTLCPDLRFGRFSEVS